MSSIPVPPILATLVGRIAAAVPARARTTFLELLIGAAATKSGHVTDAILTSGLSRTWTTYYWFLERGRWSWLRIWEVLLGVLTTVFAPAVWHVIVDDSVFERISRRAPGSLNRHNHNAKPNRPEFLRGQGWLCLAAVVERGFNVGAVPLMLRLVRRGTNRGKLRSARFLLRLLGQQLGQVRVLLDAWFMRGWLIRRTLADGHTVIGRVRRDLALYEVPRPPRRRRRGRPRKYGARLTPARVEALPVHRSARILYGNLEVVRWRSCRVAARFLHGMVVRAVWVELERPDRPDKPPQQRLLICTDPQSACPRRDHRIREKVGRRASVQRHEARLGAEGRLAAFAPSADAGGYPPRGRLCAHHDAGLHRPGAPGRTGRARPLATARHPDRRCDPGGHLADFARHGPARLHRGDVGENPPRGTVRRPTVIADRRPSRVDKQT